MLKIYDFWIALLRQIQKIIAYFFYVIGIGSISILLKLFGRDLFINKVSSKNPSTWQKPEYSKNLNRMY